MLGLPKSTEISKPIYKNVIYRKFQLKNSLKDDFDKDISRITIVNEISPYSISLDGNIVKSIFVCCVVLKCKDFQEKNIVLISKLISQNMLLLLQYEDEYKLAIYHTKLLQTSWQSLDMCDIKMSGTTLDKIWENIVIKIGGIEVAEGNTLEEQISIEEQKLVLQKQIASLKKKISKEKQLNVQMKLNGELKKLKKELEVL